jgi:pimeloyl-ACP methyl ester carboxylesterase
VRERLLKRTAYALGGILVLLVALVLAGRLYDRTPVEPGAWLRSEGLEAPLETIDGHRLRYVRVGEGPAVVLVHGFASSLYTWKDVLPALSEGHEVVALDLPGFGGSDRPADLSFEELPAAVLGLMNHLGISTAALVGNSMGGAVVAVVAATQPDRVSALVLIDAAGFNLAPEARPAMVRLVTSPLSSLLEPLPGKRVLVERALRQVLYDDAFVTEERVAEYLDALRRPGSLAAQRSLMLSLEGRTDLVTSRLSRIQAPTLVLWGRQDSWIPPADAERFTSEIPDARSVLLENCGHMPQVERAPEVSRLLVEFLAETASGRGDPTSSRE